MSDGVLHLEYAEDGGRILSVTKLRGSRFKLGRHSLRITNDGLQVYPRLVPEAHSRPFTDEQISSGVERLDALLGGGIERGSITMLTGPSGVVRNARTFHPDGRVVVVPTRISPTLSQSGRSAPKGRSIVIVWDMPPGCSRLI